VVFADPAFTGVKAWATVPHTQLIEVPFSTWSRKKSQLWEQIVLPWSARQSHCDLVHHPIGTCPRWNMGVKTVVTLHDLNFYHHPEWVAPAFRRWLLNTAVPGIRKANHVVLISDYVLDDVLKTLKLAPEKTSRIYNGLRPMAKPPTELKNGFGKSNQVILGVNLWQPHKNLTRLLAAFRLLRQEFPDLELHLAGRPQAQFIEQPELHKSLEAPGVKVLGYLSESALAEAYATATVFCYPSLEEGFGLPILEAMLMGTRVATSNASCLPEIARGAAMLFDPLSPKSMADILKQGLTESAAEREKAIAYGKTVAASYTWESAAKEYTSVYENIVR
jgi:glycosyltransferase involved in cell wall biosynthesis